MNFPDQLLPAALLWTCNALALPLLVLAVRTAPWGRLIGQETFNAWLGMCVGLLLLWSIKAGIRPGLSFHLLGGTLLTLMFGARLAMAGLAVVLLGVTLAGAAGWASLGVNWLLGGVLPVTLSYLLYAVVDRKLPNHLFVYIFVNAFIGAGLVVLITGAAVTLLLELSGAYPGAYLARNYLPYYILMGWSEALLTGMAVTLMVVFRPAWLSTFSDLRYLKSNTDRNR
ncbi:cobalt transport protein CbiM [mine drainage metagenome]|uniref:Cobalt transport protein CbiM n=1 Tax=mine drainage metagenome TaxID=410659 RepID=A0A1J5QIQ0_9ZZZZ